MNQFFYLFLIFSSVLLCSNNNSNTNNDPKTEVALGKLLFFDPILSRDGTMSCASCHNPSLAFADTIAVHKGINGYPGFRNTPSVMNMSARTLLFYDGRASNLVEQVHFPIQDVGEMDHDLTNLLQRLTAHPLYPKYFQSIYQSEVSIQLLSQAIAAFEESLETDNSEFDAWMNDQPNRMTEAAIRGRELFMSPKAKCFDCHFGPDFTGDEFRNIGLYDDIKYIDRGRYNVTKDSADIGKFKTPGLRNIAITYPYMHDGSISTLKEVIKYYNNPELHIKNPINIDSLLSNPLGLTESEINDIEAFLISLTDRQFSSLVKEKYPNFEE